MNKNLKHVMELIREILGEFEYEMISDYESEFKITESFRNKKLHHRICIKVVEEVY